MSGESQNPLENLAATLDLDKARSPVSHAELWSLLVRQALINQTLLLALTRGDNVADQDYDDLMARNTELSEMVAGLLAKGPD